MMLLQAAMQQPGSDLGSIVAGSAVTTSTIRALLGKVDDAPFDQLASMTSVSKCSQAGKHITDQSILALQVAQIACL